MSHTDTRHLGTLSRERVIWLLIFEEMGKDNFHVGLKYEGTLYPQSFAICDTRVIKYGFEDSNGKPNGENPEEYYFVGRIFCT